MSRDIEETAQLLGRELGRIHLRLEILERHRLVVDEREQLGLGVLSHLDLHQHEADIGGLAAERGCQFVHARGVALHARATTLQVDVALKDAGYPVAKPFHRVADRLAEERSSPSRETEKRGAVRIVEVVDETEILGAYAASWKQSRR